MIRASVVTAALSLALGAGDGGSIASGRSRGCHVDCRGGSEAGNVAQHHHVSELKIGNEGSMARVSPWPLHGWLMSKLAPDWL